MFKFDKLKKIDADDVLNVIGLQTKTRFVDWILPGVGFFSAGILIGTGIGLFAAPKPGKKLVADLRQKFQVGKDELAQKLPQINAPPMPAQRS